MAPVLRTAWLSSAVARVTGDSGRKVNEGKRYRIEVLSADGHRCGVSVQVDTHRKEALPYAMNQIADRWHIQRTELRSVLESWSSEQLVEHLSRFTKQQLMPPNSRT